jgi:putative lipoic acid-binding regulatory protein
MSETEQKIEFPVDWSYRIIVESGNESCLDAIEAVLKSYGIKAGLEKKSNSSSGKYQAYRLQVVFDSQELMDSLSSDLAAVDGVKFIL